MQYAIFFFFFLFFSGYSIERALIDWDASDRPAGRPAMYEIKPVCMYVVCWLAGWLADEPPAAGRSGGGGGGVGGV